MKEAFENENGAHAAAKVFLAADSPERCGQSAAPHLYRGLRRVAAFDAPDVGAEQAIKLDLGAAIRARSDESRCQAGAEYRRHAERTDNAPGGNAHPGLSCLFHFGCLHSYCCERPFPWQSTQQY
ncbi:hypothetical protein BCEN4_330005 [Burkholderia cenocepacia]|nr:hypothetical protein BCEN4_330005 [Burkholderia cenocepacia]